MDSTRQLLCIAEATTLEVLDTGVKAHFPFCVDVYSIYHLCELPLWCNFPSY